MAQNNIESTQTARALKFFTVESEAKKLYKCVICEKVRSAAANKSNLVSHMKSIHTDVYNEKICSTKNFAVKRLQLLQCCVEKTTINKEPFRNILKSAFQKLIAKKLNKLHASGYGLNLTSKDLHPVKNHIKDTAKKIRDYILSEVEGRMISVMIDIATKNSRSVLGTSIQYKIDGSTVIRTIGLIELTESHTAEYIAEELIKCLESYKIKLTQIISITTDNAANMAATIKRLNEACEESVEENVNTEKPDVSEDTILFISDENFEQELHDVLHETDATDQEVLDSLLDENEEFAELLSSLVTDFSRKYTTTLVHVNGVSCAAHTLQLAVNDGLKSLNLGDKSFISLCRRVGKFIRLNSTKCAIKKCGIKYKWIRPDVITRWGSTYLMVCIKYVSIFRLKNTSFCLYFFWFAAIRYFGE